MDDSQCAVRQLDWLDRGAIALSGLCIIHCLGTAMLVAMIASAGSIFLHPMIHEIGLGLAAVIGIIALGRGSLIHGFMLPAAIGGLGIGVMAGAMSVHDMPGMHESGGELMLTILGVALVALGHDLNRRALA